MSSVVSEKASSFAMLSATVKFEAVSPTTGIRATLESLESSDSRFEWECLELWSDADEHRGPGAEIEPLTNIILGRRSKLN